MCNQFFLNTTLNIFKFGRRLQQQIGTTFENSNIGFDWPRGVFGKVRGGKEIIKKCWGTWEDQEAYRPRVAVRLRLTAIRVHFPPGAAYVLFPVRCSARTLPSVRIARAARALRCTFRTVEHLHHSESMMSRSGAGIPHSRSAPRARRGGPRPPPIGRELHVGRTNTRPRPPRQHDPTRARESVRVSPCVCFT